jgi:FkbM family methyltransferase
MILKKTSKILQLLQEKGAVSAMFEKRKFSFASYKINRTLKKNIPELNTILDAGANQGQFALMASKFYPGANVYSFEPLPDTFNVLKKNTLSFGDQIHIYNSALGSTTGQLKFYRNQYSHISSALPIDGKNHHPKYDQSITDEILVPISTVDEMAATIEIKQPCLLKLDVQGFEKEVIKGASDTLKFIDYILIEMPFFSLYENQPLFNELQNILNDCGFEIWMPLDVNYGNDNDIIEIDYLFKRKKA